MLPASYIVQPQFICVGEFGWGGGFAEVSKGDHRGCPVAIKHLRIGVKDDFDKIFKVSSHIRPAVPVAQSQPSGFVEKFSFGNVYLTRTSCLCWGFLCPRIPNISA